MSKTASGYGRFSRARFEYSPVSGERKSGIPALVEMPAPVRTTTRLTLSDLRCSATEPMVRSFRVLEGMASSTSSWEESWPIFALEAGLLGERMRAATSSTLEVAAPKFNFYIRDKKLVWCNILSRLLNRNS